MPDITLTVSTGFLAKMRAAIVEDQPELAGQPNTVLNEAVRVFIRQKVRRWVNDFETRTAIVTAAAAVVPPTDADIA